MRRGCLRAELFDLGVAASAATSGGATVGEPPEDARAVLSFTVAGWSSRWPVRSCSAPS
ncbi:hypothetical protein [Nonomuraea sp. NPDC050786]|uniref:hypothetical protein n=1 Tax=Nonomuraea sp. NPDC050786 TaxID=3154840 RepID=UPI0033C7F43B